MSSKKQRLRLGAAAAISAGLLVPLATFAGVGFASSSSAQYQYKVTICHHTHSTKNPWVTIRISNTAVKAHLKHHDTLGTCPPKPTSPVTPAAAAPAQVSTPAPSGSSPGNSGESHGNSAASPGHSGGSPGNSANAPGHNK